MKVLPLNVVERSFSFIYRILGSCVGRFPVVTLLLSLIVSILLSSGSAITVPNRDDTRIWVPSNSRTLTDLDFINEEFEQSAVLDGETVTFSSPSMNQVMLISSNVLDEAVLGALFDVHEAIVATPEYTDVCYETFPGNCLKSSLLCAWDYNRATFNADTDKLQTITDNLHTSCNIANSLAELTMDGSKASSASATLAMYFTIPSTHTIDVEHVIETEIQKLTLPDGVEVHLNMSYSMGDALTLAFTGDVFLLGAGFVLAYVFLFLVLSKPHWILSRVLLATAGIVSIALAVGVSQGVLKIVRFASTSVNQVVPFLILGIGCDDIFVITSAINHRLRDALKGSDPPGSAPTAISVRHVIAGGMAEAGPAITITTLSNLLAFSTCLLSSLPAIHAFGVAIVLALVCTFLVQITFFLACVTLDIKRINARRLDVIPIVGVCSSWFVRQIRDVEIDPEAATTPHPQLRKVKRELIAGRCQCSICSSARRAIVRPSIVQIIFSFYTKLLVHPLFLLFGITVFVSLTGVAIYGATNLQQDFQLTDLLPNGSSVWKFYDRTLNLFSGLDYSCDVLMKSPFIAYHVTGTQSEIQSMMTDLDDTGHIQRYRFDETWLGGFIAWHTTAFSSPPPTDLSSFNTKLATYLGGPGAKYKTDVVLDGGSVKYSRLPVVAKPLGDVSSQKRMLGDIRAAVDSYPFLASPYSFSFTNIEQFEVIIPEALWSMGLSVLVVLVLTLIMLPSIRLALLAFSAVAMILFTLVGLLPYFDIKFNSVSTANLILAAGLAIDFTIHVCHAYYTATIHHTVYYGDMSLLKRRFAQRRVRTVEALRTIGPPVVYGGMSTLLATAPLFLATTGVFIVFFLCFLLLVLISLTYGVLLLPQALLVFGATGFSKRNMSADRPVNDEVTIEYSPPTGDDIGCTLKDDYLVGRGSVSSMSRVAAEEEGDMSVTSVTDETGTGASTGDNVDGDETSDTEDSSDSIESIEFKTITGSEMSDA